MVTPPLLKLMLFVSCQLFLWLRRKSEELKLILSLLVYEHLALALMSLEAFALLSLTG